MVRGKVQIKASVESKDKKIMTQVHSQHKMSTRMQYTWRGRRRREVHYGRSLFFFHPVSLMFYWRAAASGCWFQCLCNEWRGIFGWSYKWRVIMGWGSGKEQPRVLRCKVPFVLVERDGKWDQKLGKLAVYVHINMEDAKHPVPLGTVYHQLHPVPSSS